MSMITTQATRDAARTEAIKQKVIDPSYKFVKEEEVFYRGRSYIETTYAKENYGVKGHISSVFTGKFGEAKNGGTKKVYVKCEETVISTRLYDREGKSYDYTKADQLRDYVNLPEVKKQLRQRGGHLYFPIAGKSAFIHIADGDLNKSKKVSYIEMWKAGEGGPIKNTKEYYRAINSYIAAYDEIKEKWKEEVPKMALRLTKRFYSDPTRNGTGERINYNEDDAVHKLKLEEMKKLVKKERKTVVIDFKNKELRFYGDINPNKTNTGSFRTGTAVKLGKDLSKEIDSIHDASQNEVKGNLKGERPFKDPIPKKDKEESDNDNDINNNNNNNIINNNNNNNNVLTTH